MPQDTSPLETDLRNLDVAALDVAFLDRLEACAEDTWSTPTPRELLFEQQLRAIKPAQLPAALIAALETKLSASPFPEPDAKIVRFPQSAPSVGQPRRNYKHWKAAAAVALIGASAAFFVPLNKDAKQQAANPPAPAPVQPIRAASNLVPAGFDRGIRETHDEGVIWQNKSHPTQVIKVVYNHRVTVKDKNGRIYQIEKPRVEYILLPAKID